MGNYKFRLSDMMPNAWFYKLRDMSITRNNSHPPSKKKPSPNTKPPTSQKPSYLPSRQSFYYSSSDFSARSGEFCTSNAIPRAPDLPFFPDPPRRSSKHRRTRRKTVYKPSPRRRTTDPFVSVDDQYCTCHASAAVVGDLFDSSTDASVDFDFLKSPSSEFESDTAVDANEYTSLNGQASRSSSCSCGFSSSAADIIIDVDAKSYTCRKIGKLDGFDSMLELDLPPILTKPAKFDDALQEAAKFRSPTTKSVEKKSEAASFSIKIAKEESVMTKKETTTNSTTPPGTRKSVSYSSGIKLRANSPRLTSKRIQASGRKSVSRRTKLSQRKGFAESFAIVKASVDPEKDFRESMMEMIVENNIRASKDLEELLACYLSLNSDEYHGLIIKAFEQIWFNMPDLNL